MLYHSHICLSFSHRLYHSHIPFSYVNHSHFTPHRWWGSMLLQVLIGNGGNGSVTLPSKNKTKKLITKFEFKHFYRMSSDDFVST